MHRAHVTTANRRRTTLMMAPINHEAMTGGHKFKGAGGSKSKLMCNLALVDRTETTMFFGGEGAVAIGILEQPSITTVTRSRSGKHRDWTVWTGTPFKDRRIKFPTGWPEQ